MVAFLIIYWSCDINSNGTMYGRAHSVHGVLRLKKLSIELKFACQATGKRHPLDTRDAEKTRLKLTVKKIIIYNYHTYYSTPTPTKHSHNTYINNNLRRLKYYSKNNSTQAHQSSANNSAAVPCSIGISESDPSTAD